jgi:hypothetical protein
VTLFYDLKRLAAELDARRERELQALAPAVPETPLEAVSVRLIHADRRLMRHRNHAHCTCEKCKVARADMAAALDEERSIIAAAPVDEALLGEMRASADADDAHRDAVNARDRRRGFCPAERAGDAIEEGFRQWETYGVKSR